ncbi:KTSC domain-containing protein [Mucilaginibacter segetis]|uniref:KTSC domain-containing protein n=1 Tax=Mucilaginibacter segetis TaxID=2793071 RepID=A0A934PWZ0_9SPHI|nr:KTSC domain-containing protein [Mucilaginibacter segetis]MBK0380548.1 KTSC domain-containing protein [Mucilaginibacter segetis]
MHRKTVESTALKSIGYDAEKHVLELEFRESGDVWQYLNVKPAVYKKMMESESLGSFFVNKVKGVFDENKIK